MRVGREADVKREELMSKRRRQRSGDNMSNKRKWGRRGGREWKIKR